MGACGIRRVGLGLDLDTKVGTVGTRTTAYGLLVGFKSWGLEAVGWICKLQKKAGSH